MKGTNIHWDPKERSQRSDKPAPSKQMNSRMKLEKRTSRLMYLSIRACLLDAVRDDLMIFVWFPDGEKENHGCWMRKTTTHLHRQSIHRRDQWFAGHSHAAGRCCYRMDKRLLRERRWVCHWNGRYHRWANRIAVRRCSPRVSPDSWNTTECSSVSNWFPHRWQRYPNSMYFHPMPRRREEYPQEWFDQHIRERYFPPRDLAICIERRLALI